MCTEVDPTRVLKLSFGAIDVYTDACGSVILGMRPAAAGMWLMFGSLVRILAVQFHEERKILVSGAPFSAHETKIEQQLQVQCSCEDPQ